MTSPNGNIFCVTGHLCGEFTGHQWIPHTKVSDARLYVSLICAWINGWINNREAGDLRRQRAHYYVIGMSRWHDGVIRNPMLSSLIGWFIVPLYTRNQTRLYRCSYVQKVLCKMRCHLFLYMILINTSRPRQMVAISQTTFSNGFFLNENVWIPIKISLEFVPKGHIKVDPYYKVLWFSWKLGKRKKMRVWFHSRKDSGVNPT